MYHARILNRRRSVSVIINTILGVAVFWKVQIKPTVNSESTDGDNRYMYKAVKKIKAIQGCMKYLALHTGAPTVHR